MRSTMPETLETMARPGAELRAKLGLLSPLELATILDVTTETLREWRRLRQGPDFVKTGKGVMYREIDVHDWMSRNVVPVVRA